METQLQLPLPQRGTAPIFGPYRPIYCGQMARWIKMPPGTEVGLGPGDTVLHGEPAPPKGAQPPIFGPRLLWPSGYMHQDTTWYGGRPQPRKHCVRWGHSYPSPKGHSPQFSANVRCGQTSGWTKMPLGMEVGLGPGDFVLDGDPAPPQKNGTTPPNFRPIVAKRLDG